MEEQELLAAIRHLAVTQRLEVEEVDWVARILPKD
jgi:hypothetical protein